ncbi:homoserine/homoserine lactone efflux protein [Octadecabacter temperatus]|uniref:Homoserine/homoserine lactone efflux protein n=1 Tax=Octadecabacter temperatus TaxID=1458307 RepID=A0A0K0Y9F4_9RHOB|nr:LysE family translocator [Octadecabacter temperatus]AKS47545.1 Homoserine/homoserine lactone efflux protein [Octadecabacter temperatus]SIO41456.1 homoserine/homoserine lactone efflux protein [Octadecabacter temperatus]
MTFEAWSIFALFWVVFVTTPGPNAVNCISNGMTRGFVRSLPAVAAILTQASLFLALSAFGVTALLAASETAFSVAKLIGAGFLIYLGVRGWITATRPVVEKDVQAGSIYWRALAIAVINPKSVAGYLAAFSQFVQPNVPIDAQMWAIVPTALTLTACSYLTYTALGAGLGRAAMGAVFNVWFRRVMAVCFIVYGVLLGTSQPVRSA